MIKAHKQAATPTALRAMETLRDLPALREFYLAGGTALALRLGHRVSVDLDFFSRTNALRFKERESIKAAIRGRRPCRVKEEQDGTLHLVLEETAVSFLHYPYPLLKPTSDWQGITLASIEDIALMKLGAVVGRGARKDFIDLYAICRQLPLARLFRLTGRKFKNSGGFALQAAKALTYFEDAEKDPMPELLARMDWNEVKVFFEREVPKAFDAIQS